MSKPTYRTVTLKMRLPLRLRLRLKWWALKDYFWRKRNPVAAEVRDEINRRVERAMFFGEDHV